MLPLRERGVCVVPPLARRSSPRTRAASGAAQRTAKVDERFRSVGFSTELAPDDLPGEAVRVEVGEVGERFARRSYVFDKRLPGASTLFTVRWQRPLGCVFVEDTSGRVRVAELVAGSQAQRSAAVGRLSPARSESPAVGDVLRGVTCTLFSFSAGAHLLGDLSSTRRTVVLFGADDQPFDKVAAALRQGLVADGAVTLVLERPGEASPGAVWRARPAVESESDGAALPRGQARARRGQRPVVEVDPPGGPLLAAAAVTGLTLLVLLITGFTS